MTKSCAYNMSEIMTRQIILVAAWICLSATAMARDYDLVIMNGRVMDPETAYDEVANMGIKDGRIAVITKKSIEGKVLAQAPKDSRLPTNARCYSGFSENSRGPNPAVGSRDSGVSGTP